MASLTIRNVGKVYGTVRAIADLSVSVKDGECLVLVGPSGCGKSTLLRMIAGLETLTEGEMFLGERNVSAVDPKDRDVAMVFQNYALYPHMTVYQNMAFSLEQRKAPKGQIRETVTRTARILDLEALIDRKPGALSGGQRQRVAMGRAIVRNPAIYLMDEPLSNLDAKLRVQMRAELKLMRARLGVTTVYVTHDQIEAMTLGDRVAVMAPYSERLGSNLQQVDSPQTLYHEPRNMFVAGFIGSPAMNFFYVDVEEAPDGIAVSIEGTETRFSLTAKTFPQFSAMQAYVGRRVVMGIRPEFFTMQPTGAGAGHATVAVDLLVSELVGPDAFLHFDLPTPEVHDASITAAKDMEEAGSSKSRFTARVSSEDVTLHTGRIDLHFASARVHFFDIATSARIAAVPPG